MTSLVLQAVDVWLFRDGRPFDPASGRRAESLFPPYPTVIQGAIRSYHLVVKHVDLRDAQKIRETVGTPVNYEASRMTEYKGLRLRGPFLAKVGGDRLVRYFPQPADAVTVDRVAHTIRPASGPESTPEASVRASLTRIDKGLLLLGFRDPLEKGETGLWLSEEALLEYLGGETVMGTPTQDLFERESRFGIGMNSGRQTVEEGMLYEVEFIRPAQDVGLLVEMSGYDGWPETGILQLGGESRAAVYNTKEDVAPWPSIPHPLPRKFKVYFATPTFFEGGWRGDWGKFFGGEVMLRAAALNRYESVGGFDWANISHKPARRYIPAGSVYYFEHHGNAHLKADLPQNAITDFGAEIGFGQIVIPAKEW